VAVDAKGNLFISDKQNYRIRKITPDGIIKTVAGNGKSGFSGDGKAATSAQFSIFADVDVDAAGNLYIIGGNRIRKVAPNGIISSIAIPGVKPINNGSLPPAPQNSDRQLRRSLLGCWAFDRLDRSGKGRRRVKAGKTPPSKMTAHSWSVEQLMEWIDRAKDISKALREMA
jgi:hypothetical protein